MPINLTTRRVSRHVSSNLNLYSTFPDMTVAWGEVEVTKTHEILLSPQIAQVHSNTLRP
jgi:hypothetical protein